jgi:hypothetical protein
MNLDTLWPFQLTRGHSKEPAKGACLLDAVSWFEDGRLDDRPKCVSPVLACLGHLANDILNDKKRQELRRFIPRLVGTVDKEADRRRVSYLLFVCEEFARRWHDAPLSYYALENRFEFWSDRTRIAKDPREDSLSRTLLLTERLNQATLHLQGVHRWVDRSELPPIGALTLGADSPKMCASVKLHEITAQEDVAEIAIDLLDVCCAIGAPQTEWDFSRVPAAVKRFSRAREAV